MALLQLTVVMHYCAFFHHSQWRHYVFRLPVCVWMCVSSSVHPVWWTHYFINCLREFNGIYNFSHFRTKWIWLSLEVTWLKGKIITKPSMVKSQFMTREHSMMTVWIDLTMFCNSENWVKDHSHDQTKYGQER